MFQKNLDYGNVRFVGREDDVITSSGYRIGPAEIEDCLLTHPAVQLAGVVGAPDPVRGNIVAAFVQLAPGFAGSDTLALEIMDHVKTRLAAYEAPRAVHFIPDMPKPRAKDHTDPDRRIARLGADRIRESFSVL